MTAAAIAGLREQTEPTSRVCRVQQAAIRMQQAIQHALRVQQARICRRLHLLCAFAVRHVRFPRLLVCLRLIVCVREAIAERMEVCARPAREESTNTLSETRVVLNALQTRSLRKEAATSLTASVSPDTRDIMEDCVALAKLESTSLIQEMLPVQTVLLARSRI